MTDIEETPSQPQEAQSDKELNFARLREKTKRLEMEALEHKKRAEELQAMREKDRRELEELRARQEEMALESQLFFDEEESPDELIDSKKLKEKQKKLSARQAHVLRKELDMQKKHFQNELERIKEANKNEIEEALATKELTRLYTNYGEEGINQELEANTHLKTALSLMPNISQRAHYLSQHFAEKEKANKMLKESERQQKDPMNTGIGAGLSGGNMQIEKASLNPTNYNDPKFLQSFNDEVLSTLKKRK